MISQFRRFASAAVFALCVPAGLIHAETIGQLGVLQDTANGGINPVTGEAWKAGDKYRLIFLSSGTTSVTSADISTYNTYVQGLADTAGLGGATWTVVGSTDTVAARDNTGTNPGSATGVAFFKMDGTTLLATDNNDLWSNGVDSFVNIDENGDVVTTNIDRIATGSDSDGTSPDANPGQTFGGSETNVRTGHANKTGGNWMIDFNAARTGRRVFAMSEELTVVPEPGSLALLGLGSLLIARRRRD